MKKKYVWFLCLLSFLGSLQLAAQTFEISGKVVDNLNQEELPGVGISVKNSTRGTVTNSEGQFKLSVSKGEVVVISFVGYETQEKVVRENDKIWSISLISDAKALEEVVVIGYGEVKKSNVTGAIVSVKEADLKTVPTTNVMESLQGKLPGVDITRSSGQAGAGVNIVVRGNRSLTASNSPLFIVDGIQYNSIQDLNSNDIQSMEVLKDAASTAVYGSRGANGVILITTKKGVKGKTKVSLNTYFGQSELAGYPQVQSAEEFKNFRREANRTIGNWSGPQDDNKIFSGFENSPGTDWQRFFLQKGSQQDHQIGISSSTEKTNFYASLNYFKENGLFEKDEMSRYSVRTNIDHKVSKVLNIGTQNQITFYSQSFRSDPLNVANQLNPLETPFDENGQIVPLLNNGRQVNPLMDVEPNNFENSNRSSRVFTAAYAELRPFKGFLFRSNVGVTIQNLRDGLYANSFTVLRNGALPLATYTQESTLEYNIENIASYSKTQGAHSWSITGVHSVLSNRSERISARGTNQLIPNQLFYGLANANQEVTISSQLVGSGLISYTGRFQYGYKDKYLFMATGRSDGASQLSEGNKWAFFPSASFAWRIIEESFLKDISWITDLKIRASYGVAGNSAVSPYATQSNLIRVPYAWDERPAIGYTFGNRVGNANLGWELSRTNNIGLDFGLFNNRLTGTLDVYSTLTKDLLLQRLLPLSSGFNNIIENIGETQTRGIELGLGAILVNKKDFRWNVNANWFTANEKILSLATTSNDVANGWFIGYPTQAFFDYEKMGIWQTNEADQAAKFNQKPGDIKVKDQNNDGIIDATNDRVVLGTERPTWSGNLNQDFSYKGFDLHIQLFARWGQMMRYAITGNYDPQANGNSLRHDYWTPENPTNEFPRPNANRSQAATLFYSSMFFKDASFVKLRGITLGYTLPSAALKKLGISSVRVYVSGRNLITWSKIKNYDPERGGSLTNPMTRLVVTGLNLEF